jgi:hypothetical protein
MEPSVAGAAGVCPSEKSPRIGWQRTMLPCGASKTVSPFRYSASPSIIQTISYLADYADRMSRPPVCATRNPEVMSRSKEIIAQTRSARCNFTRARIIFSSGRSPYGDLPVGGGEARYASIRAEGRLSPIVRCWVFGC